MFNSLVPGEAWTLSAKFGIRKLETSLKTLRRLGMNNQGGRQTDRIATAVACVINTKHYWLLVYYNNITDKN